MRRYPSDTATVQVTSQDRVDTLQETLSTLMVNISQNNAEFLGAILLLLDLISTGPGQTRVRDVMTQIQGIAGRKPPGCEATPALFEGVDRLLTSQPLKDFWSLYKPAK